MKTQSEVLKKLKISSDYLVSESNPDYFQSEPSKEILKESPDFESIETMKAVILGPLNKDFDEDVHVLSVTANYIRLKCIY